MVIFVRVALVTTVLALCLMAAGTSGRAHAATPSPTQAQIQRAVQKAENSPSLWATINICDTKQHPSTIGVRGQMPTLGFASWLSMRVQLNYYSSKQGRFLSLPKASSLLRLGRMSKDLQQLGATFSFKASTQGLFNARISFIWRRWGRLLGQTSRRTTAGHPNAAFGDPKHYSAKQCRIP
jgi:hypothetical protein